MQTQAINNTNHGKVSRRGFFCSGALRSGHFLVASAFVVAAVTEDIILLWTNWEHLSFSMASLLIFFGLTGVAGPWLWVWHSHNRIRELYEGGRLSERGSDEGIYSSLDIVAKAMLNGLVFSSGAIFVLLLSIAFFLRRVP
jgi:hypothetical protein